MTAKRPPMTCGHCGKGYGNGGGHCTGCHESFNSDTAFDKHRTGDYDTGRRCMTADEMTAKGMSKNSKDWWITATGGHWRSLA